MSKPAVSQAQIKRLVTALEKMGKTVTGVRTWPDGSVEACLTGEPAEASNDDEADSWDAAFVQ